MRYLLDTNVFLWFALNDERINPEQKSIIEASDNEIFISAVSLWEIGIKHSLGKITISGSLRDFFSDIDSVLQMRILPIHREHVIKVSTLPFLHRDPFDRLIYAQSLVEKFILLYTDNIFNMYQNENTGE
jgi:PIN domain nuclease of toxin-antitoxin system